MSIMTLKRLMMLTMMVFILSACSSKDEQMEKNDNATNYHHRKSP